MLVVWLYASARRILAARDRTVPHWMRKMLFKLIGNLGVNDAGICSLFEVCGVFELWRVACRA